MEPVGSIGRDLAGFKGREVNDENVIAAYISI